MWSRILRALKGPPARSVRMVVVTDRPEMRDPWPFSRHLVSLSTSGQLWQEEGRNWHFHQPGWRMVTRGMRLSSSSENKLKLVVLLSVWTESHTSSVRTLSTRHRKCDNVQTLLVYLSAFHLAYKCVDGKLHLALLCVPRT